VAAPARPTAAAAPADSEARQRRQSGADLKTIGGQGAHNRITRAAPVPAAAATINTDAPARGSSSVFGSIDSLAAAAGALAFLFVNNLPPVCQLEWTDSD
jgi:hypothetical protein